MTIWLSWSSGKDCAWALHRLRQDGCEVSALFTTINEAADRVAMHGVRRELLLKQAHAAGLPLHIIPLPWPCTNAQYEQIMAAFLKQAQSAGVTKMAFGDLFLDDIRNYRVRNLANTGIEPLFPVWGIPTAKLASEMLSAGLRARLATVDLAKLDQSFAGRNFDNALLADLPEGIDPCGENGEFHTFVTQGPMFRESVEVEVGETIVRDGFAFADLVLAG